MPLTLVHTLSGHTDRVWCCAWSPSGKALATCGSDKVIRLWVEQTDAEGKTEFVCKQVLDGTHSRTIRCVSWSPNGRYLASAGFDGLTAIWERDSEGEFECVATLEGHENEVKWVSWARNGQLLATCSRDKSVWVWAAEGGAAANGDGGAGGEKEFECLSVLNGHTQDVKVAKWHPTIDSMLISASYDNTIKVWTEEDDDWYATETLTGHTSTVWSIAFNADGSQLASCSDDGTIRVWERTTKPAGEAPSSDANTTPSTTVPGSWQMIGQLSGHHSRCIYTVDWSKEGVLASGAADDSICIFGPSSGVPASGATSSSASAAGAPASASPPAPSSADTLAADPTSAPKGLALWHIELNAHAGDVNCVAWNPTQPNVLCSAGDDGVIKIWKLTQ